MIDLRDYQIKLSNSGFEALKKHGIVYYAIEPRCGKTHIALQTVKLYGASNVLFLTKKKAIPSIEKDFLNGEYKFEIFITNYEQLGKFKGNFDFIICDEAHCLGAYPKASNRAKFLHDHCGNTPITFLSGTPTPEGYSQIYHQLKVSNRSPYRHYKNFYHWARDYVDIFQERRGLYMVNNYSKANEDKIKKDIEPFFITYSQDQAGFKCDVREHFHEVIIPEIPFLIKKLFKDRILYIGEKKNIVLADTPAKLMSKMHQISGGSVICEDEVYNIISYEKALYIKNVFLNMRIAIYYKFQSEKKILQEIFKDHTEVPEEFQSGKSDIFISQVLSGREGIALHNADALIMYNIDYSATSYWQVRARIQDFNRKEPVQVHWIFTKGGVEKRVYEAVSAKKDFTYSYFRKNVKL